MNATPSSERRTHKRFPLATSVQFFHDPSQRDFPGRSVDVSDGGMLMYVPATVPVHIGQCIRMDLAAVPRNTYSGPTDSKVQAKVVRVDRNALLSTGHIAVGVQFQA